MNTLVSRSPIRSLEVLDVFRIARQPLSLSEIARLSRLPVSTCHGVMRALEYHGFLYFLSPREAYPTRRLWDMASAIEANDPIAQHLAPALQALRDETGETVILGTRQRDRVVYLQVIESTQSIRYSSRVGEHKPLHSSAIGKCLLGTMPRAELDAWLATHRLERVTDATCTDANALRSDLDAGRGRGWYVTRGENVADVMALAAPLQLGSLTLAIAVAGPIHRMARTQSGVASQLLACAQRIGQHAHNPQEITDGR
ncbi:MAG: IclR family transcriptional regulator [Burkholderiaceae bacterium]|nr:IclR family transcriptional regulator [Burkholderiaceae bacterium]